MKKILLTLLAFGFFGIAAQAQTWDDSGDSWDNSGDTWDDGTTDGGDYNYDPGSGSGTMDSTSDGDDWSDDSWSDDSWGGDGATLDMGFGGADEYKRSSRPEATSRPYERFTGMPYDSATELVTYVEVVEVVVPDRFLDLGGDDYSLSDSLYARARKWMDTQFGEKEAKRMIEEAGMDEKGREGKTINAVVVMPLVVEHNKYAKSTAGVIQFDMELRFKDERYRYKFNNFVHITASTTSAKNEVRTYMEYYMTAREAVRGNDQILIATNNQMNQLIDGLKSTCAHVPFVDDDDW